MDDLHLEEIAEYGINSGRGNLLGIEPYVTPADYATEGTFRARLDGYMGVAHQRGWLNERTVVVWPEYLGTWLVAADEKAQVHRAKTVAAAMQPIVLRHPIQFARRWLFAREKDRAVAGIFRLKSRDMARIYQSVFAGLAAHYHVTLVAGSSVLAEPRIQDGRIVTGNGPLYNVSAVFRPDGSPHPDLVRKVYPISIELPFVTPARTSDLPAFDTPAGKLGVLICADAWYPDAYEQMRARGVELIAVPSDAGDRAAWTAPWPGYDGAPTPRDVDTRDVGWLTLAQAWHKYALAGRLAASGATCGINVFLRGELWDLGVLGGRAKLVAQRGAMIADGRADGAAILNVWL
jgi:predicted amidohydrolase